MTDYKLIALIMAFALSSMAFISVSTVVVLYLIFRDVLKTIERVVEKKYGTR
jgi:hypothetical protein